MVNGKEEGILLNEKTAPDGVFMLYHLPEGVEAERSELSANKAKAREYYNPTYHIRNDNAYDDINKPDEEDGQNIDITSKD